MSRPSSTAESSPITADLSFASIQLRRRTCVVCGMATPNSYVTSFTRVPEKQKEWVTVLANGDAEYAVQLELKLSTGRKYLCLDHFERRHLTTRKNGDGIEIIRNSSPIAYKNTDFVRKHHDELLLPATDLMSRNPEKRQKLSVGFDNRAAHLDANSMALLMNTVNFYVEQSMNESDLPQKVVSK